MDYNTLLERAMRFLKAHRRKKIWYNLVSCMAAVVVFVTTYMLILPAITMEKEASCGMEAHVHGEDCYARTQNLICGMEESDQHTHTDACYETVEEFVCTKQEHTHGKACYPQEGQGEAAALAENMDFSEDEEIIIDNTVEDIVDDTVYVELEEEYPELQESNEQNDAEIDYETEMSSDLETELFTEDLVESDAMMLMMVGSEEQNELNNLSNYITAVTGTGTTYDKLTDYYNTSLQITFAMTKQDVTNANMQFTYTYPTGILVPDTLLGQDHTGYDQNNKEAFKYRFIKNDDGTYGMTVTFLESYLNSAGDNLKGFINFNGKIDGSCLNNKGDISCQFNEQVSLVIYGENIQYDKDTTRNYDLHITKSGQYVDGNILRYKVEVYSMKGTPTDITLTDILRINGLDIASVENVSVTQQNYEYHRPYTGNGNWEQATGDESNVTPTITFDNTTDTLTMTLPKIEGSMQKLENELLYRGSKYTIQYDYPLSGLQQNTDYTANNTANACSSDNQTGESLDVSANASLSFKVQLLEKSGTYSNGFVTWTIRVNDTKQNIKDYVLTDAMLTNLTEENITISPNDGVTVQKNEAGNITSILFTAAENEENTNRYTITYSVPVTSAWDSKQVKNTAVLDPTPSQSGDEIQKEAEVTVPGNQSVEKTLVSAGKPTGEKIDLTWKFGIQVPEGGTPQTLKIEDLLTGNTSGDSADHYMTISQIREWAEMLEKEENQISDAGLKWLSKADASTLELQKTDGSWVKYSEVKDNGEEIKYTGFHFNMKESLEENTKVELTYHSYADISNKQNDTTYTFKNQGKAGEKSQEAQHTWSRTTKVLKMDGNNSLEDSQTSSQDGTVTWKVKVVLDEDLGEGVLKITDILPKDSSDHPLVDVVEIKYGNEWYQPNITINSNGILSGESNNMVLDTSGSKYDRDTGEVILIIKNKENSVSDCLKAGGSVWVTYTCKIKNLPNSGSSTYRLTNRVNVDKNDISYGSDDQTQEHTVNIPDKVLKMDGQNQIGTTVSQSEDGIVTWKVKVYQTEDFSELTITDQLPKGSDEASLLELQSMKIGGEYSLQDLTISEGTITMVDSNSVLDLTGSTYNADSGAIVLKIKVKENASRPDYFKNEGTLWLSYTCKIKEQLQPGQEKTYSLENTVTVTKSDGTTYGQSEQTQTHTVKIPPRVIKMDGNGQERDSTTSSADGMVSWKVKVNLEDDYTKLTITDQLPSTDSAAIVTLQNLRLGASDASIQASIAEDGTISVPEDCPLNLTGSSYHSGTGKIELCVAVKDGAARPDYFKKDQSFWLVYTCKVASLPSSGTSKEYSLKNTVTVKVDEQNDTYGSDDQTQTHTVTVPEVEKLDKNGEWKNNERRLKYSVDINPEGADLLEGSDELTLEDVLSYITETELKSDNLYYVRNALLLQSSVQLYYAQKDSSGNVMKDESGHLIAGNAVPANLWKWQYEVTENYYWHIDRKHKITVQIPDEKALVFKYDYQVQMLIPENWDKDLGMSNTVTLSGTGKNDTSDSSKEKWEEVQTSGGVTSDEKRQYIFYKVDSEDYGSALSNAEFTLYKYAPGTSGADTDGYVSTGYVYRTTDGTFSIEFSASDGYSGFVKNTAYYVQETKAPEGYQLPESPQKYYFHFPDSTVSEGAYPITGNTVADQATAFTKSGAVDLTMNSHTEYCTNTKSPGKSLTVTKKWKTQTGTIVESGQEPDREIDISVYYSTLSPESLTEKNSSLYGSKNARIPNESNRTLYGTTKLSKSNGWSHTWSDIPEKDDQGNTLYYYMEESSTDGFVPQITGNGVTEGTIEIINTMTSITVQKQWTNSAGTVIPSPSDKVINVSLYKVGTEGAISTVPLGSQYANNTDQGYDGTGWSYTWSGLPEGSYYVSESEVPTGYTVTYRKGDGTGEEFIEASQMTVTSGTILITNKEEPTQITVEKIWNGSSTKPVTMQLYSSTTSPQEDTQGGEGQTTTNKTKITVKVDKWVDSNGNDASPPDSGWIWMKILECDKNGNVPDGTWEKPVFSGNLTSSEWSLTSGDLDGVTITDNSSETKYYYIQFGAGGTGNVIADVQATGSYLKSETGYVVVSGENATSQVNLKATLSTSENSGGGGTGEEKNVSLFVSGNSYNKTLAGPVTITSNSVRVAIGYDYSVNESDRNSVSWEIKEGTSTDITFSFERYEDTGSGRRYLYYIVNGITSSCVIQFNPGTSYPKDEAGWSVITEITDSESATYSEVPRLIENENLYMLSTESTPTGLILPTAHTAVGKPIKLGASSAQETGSAIEVTGLTYTWSNLPKTDENGNKLYYYVQETSTGEYSTSYEYEYVDPTPSKGISISKVKVTNTPNNVPESEYTSITVNKEWLDSSGNEKDIQTGTVKFNLYQINSTGEVKYNATPYELTRGTNNWSYTITGLPKKYVDSDGNTQEYLYSVREVSVTTSEGTDVTDKYEVSYSNNIGISSGTITITNKDKQTYTLPETGGSGTRPYTLGGLMLTAMASLLMYIQNKRRKEERDSS